jgi:carboxyl-terminal processing protease
MIREEVTIEDTFARSIVVNSKNGKKYGFIYLPSFNVEFEKKTAEGMLRMISKLN